MSFIGKQPTLNRTRYTPLSADPLNPTQGDTFYSDGTPRTEGLWTYDGSNWIQTGSAGGGLDVFHTESFESILPTSYSSGNNATFLGGGSLVGTLENETVAPMSKKVSLKYTQVAGSLNDYIASPVISLDPKQAGNDAGVNLYFKYSGNSNDIKITIYDSTNGELISSDLDLLSSESNPTRYSTSVFIPSGVTELRWGVQVVVESIGAILELDDIEFSLNPFVYSNLMEDASYTVNALGSSFTATSGVLRFGTVTSKGSNVGILEYDDSTGRFTAKKRATFVTTSNLRASGGSNLNINFNGVNYGQGNINGTHETIGLEGILEVGEYLEFGTSGSLDSAELQYISILATATSEHVITPAKSNLTDWIEYSPIISGFGAVTLTQSIYRRIGDSYEVIVKGQSGTVAASEVQIGLPNSSLISSTLSTIQVVGTYHPERVDDDLYTVLATAGDSFVNIGYRSSGASTIFTPFNGNVVNNSSTNFTLKFTVPIEGFSSDAAFLAAIPKASENSAGTLSYERYEELDVTGSGDLTGGTLLISRIGRMVTIQSKTELTHANGSNRSTATGFIPEWARPSTSSVGNAYIMTSSQLQEVIIDTLGQLYLLYYNSSFAASNRTTSGPYLTITYIVE